MAAPSVDVSRHAIVFHDGACGLCRRSITFLAARDRAGRLRFAPLQGETARVLLPAALRELSDGSSVVLRDPEGGIHLRGAAVAGALSALPWPWRGLGRVTGLRPLAPLVDALYRAVAARRTRWFAPPDACAISPELRARSLP